MPHQKSYISVISVACFIPAKSQKVIPTGIQLVIFSGYLASILGVAHFFTCEPFVCLGILNATYYG